MKNTLSRPTQADQEKLMKLEKTKTMMPCGLPAWTELIYDVAEKPQVSLFLFGRC